MTDYAGVQIEMSAASGIREEQSRPPVRPPKLQQQNTNAQQWNLHAPVESGMEKPTVKVTMAVPSVAGTLSDPQMSPPPCVLT